MPRRNQRPEHLLSPVQQRRLRQVREKFLAALDESPRDQRLINRLRAQLPPAGLSWFGWQFVLSSERTAQEVSTSSPGVTAAVHPASPSQEAAA